MAGIAGTSGTFIKMIGSLGPSIFGARLFFHRGIASKLFVKGLPFSMTEAALMEEFSKFGELVEARIPIERIRNRPKGFAFVTFASADDAKSALNDMNGKLLDGRVLYVDMAKPNQEFDNYKPIARGPPEPAAEN